MLTRRRLLIAGFSAGTLAALVPALARADNVKPSLPLKIGFVYVSPIGEAGWTYQHDLGRRAIEAAFGDKVQVRYAENVPEGADAERVIRDFAADGAGLVFTTTFGYMNPTIRIARQFPRVVFEHATGYKQDRNVGVYAGRYYEGRYLAGIVAGRMSKSGNIGYVAAFPIPEVVMGINAFTRGLRSVNRDAQVRVVWINAWFDPAKERDAADALLAQGADLVTHHTDSTAVVQAAEAKGKYAIGYHSDMSRFGPHAHLTAITHHWESFYTRTTAAVLEGRWVSENVWGGIKDGMVALAPLNAAVPADVVAQVGEQQQAIIDGTLHPFQGPLFDQAGRQVIGAGSTLTDEELLKMNYFVEGVAGRLPK